jgi:hypothetical protein
MQPTQDLQGKVRAGHEHALGDLQHQPVRRDLPGRQLAGDLIWEGGVEQAAGRDVDRDRQAKAAALPTGGLLEGGVQHPAGEGVDEPGPFGQRDELARADPETEAQGRALTGPWVLG